MRQFLILGAVAGAVAAPPVNLIVDGMVADAAPVMANIEGVIDSINENIGNYDYLAPVTGFSHTCVDACPGLILEPAGTLATGTVVMPPTPVDGQQQWCSSTTAITALTVSANTGQSILNPPTALAAGGAFTMIYRLSNTTWYRRS